MPVAISIASSGPLGVCQPSGQVASPPIAQINEK